MTGPHGAWLQALYSELDSLVRGLSERDVRVHVTGGGAVALLVPYAADLWSRAERPPPSDIDVLARGRDRMRLARGLKELGWEGDEHRNAIHGRVRHLYVSPRGFRLDVFFDALRMCHEIPMSAATHGETAAVPAEDLLLHKLQIVQLNHKDIVDISIVLLASGRGDIAVSPERVCLRTSRDWGLWMTVVRNLDTVAAQAAGFPWLAPAEAATVAQEASALLLAAQISRKSLRWHLRAIAGTRVQWYEDVEEVDR